MLARINGLKTIIAGAIFIAIGIIAFFMAHDYEIGTALRMGPGYFPALLGVVMTLFGIGAIIAGAVTRIPDPVSREKIEPLLLILAGLFSFAFLIERAGLIIAAAALIFLSCFRRLLTNPVEVVLTYVALAGFSAIVFVHYFGMVVPLFWWNR